MLKISYEELSATGASRQGRVIVLKTKVVLIIVPLVVTVNSTYATGFAALGKCQRDVYVARKDFPQAGTFSGNFQINRNDTGSELPYLPCHTFDYQPGPTCHGRDSRICHFGGLVK